MAIPPRNNATTVVAPIVNETPAGGERAIRERNAGKNNPATFDHQKKSAVEDVVHNYRWTLTDVKDRTDIPEIKLFEHRNTEPAIKRQILFYGLGLRDQASTEFQKWVSNIPFVGGAFAKASELGTGFQNWALGLFDMGPSSNKQDMLSVYDEIFPDAPTGNSYVLPYFTKSYMELTSPKWEQMDDIAQSIDKVAAGSARIMRGLEGGANQIGLDGLGKMAGGMAGTIDVLREGGAMAGELYKTYLRTQYPVVGIYDRPRVFSSHNERDVTVEFPLFNTYDVNDWKKNRDLIYKLMTQFLYIKKSYITGLPPVFYRVLVPYQYFSFASCITNFKVENLGNMRKMYNMIVPDAYQVSITLSEMVMPSLNQFQYAGRTVVEAR